jgi:hypothetical protein
LYGYMASLLKRANNNSTINQYNNVAYKRNDTTETD